MRATHHQIQCLAAALIVSCIWSGCVAICDVGSGPCAPQPIELGSSKIDKSNLKPITLKINGDILPVPVKARLSASLKKGSSPLLMPEMDVKRLKEGGNEYEISTEKLSSLVDGCTYYLDVFQDQDPDRMNYRIVDDSCKYPLTVVSGDLKWSEKLGATSFASADVANSRGLWVYGTNALVLEQTHRSGSFSFSRYEALKFNGGKFELASSTAQTQSLGSFAYFKNSQGVIADYSSTSPAMSPDLYRPTLTPGSLTLGTAVTSLAGFGVLRDIAADNTFTFFVLAADSGALTAWNMPSPQNTGLTSRKISEGNHGNANKVAVLNVDSDDRADFITFDNNGNPQVFLQWMDKNFVYDGGLTTARKDLSTGAIAAIAVGDIDGDMVDDLAIVRQAANKTITFYLKKADGSFKAAASVLNHDQPITSLAVGPVGQVSSSALNSLVVVDSASTVSVYQNTTQDACPLPTAPCQSTSTSKL